LWISVADALRHTSAGSRLVRHLTAAPDLDGWAVVERLLEDLASLEERIWPVNTVKTQMWYLSAELGADRRGQAVQRARALGLLAPSGVRIASRSR
jgi:hypothetical protein